MNKQIIYISIAHIDDEHSSTAIDEDSYIASIKEPKRKKESLVARNLLNELSIGCYGKSLPELNFRKNPHGQPILDSGSCSISHSNGWVMVGLSALPLGIDIERFQDKDMDALAVAFNENRWKTINVNPQLVIEEFSAKEAISKLRGTGFTVEPKEINLNTNEQMWHRWIEFSPGETYVLSICSRLKPEIHFESTNNLCMFVNTYED
jgi:phosphopantetheinyl transferase